MRPRRRGWRILAGGRAPAGVFEEALLPHLDALYGLALHFTRDEETAADLLQDTALRAFEKFHQLRDAGGARPWLVRILTTTFLNRYTRKSPQTLPSIEAEPVDDGTPDVGLLRRAEAEEVQAALRELRDEYRVAVLLSDVEEMPLREIATLCGCPIGTVASRLARGRNLLRKRLGHLRNRKEMER